MQLDTARDAFLGSDPIAGRAALLALLAAGDAGEDHLFAQALGVPSVQVRRRWLQYVATRPGSAGGRLLACIRDAGSGPQAAAAAQLVAGLPAGDPVHGSLRAALRDAFARGTPAVAYVDEYRRVGTLIEAAGGGDQVPWPLWRAVSEDEYAWEKLGTLAFRAACTAAARLGSDHVALLERFITHEDDAPGRRVVDDSELWLQANHTFSLWRSGSLVDEIFRRWAGHADVRVRHFGAEILGAMAFRRAQEPLLQWLPAEPDAGVRRLLQVALAQCGTPAAADALLAMDRGGDVADEAVVIAAPHASDRAAAIAQLERIAAGRQATASEALVALARTGTASRSLPQALFAADTYRRLNAALAFGILNDASRADDLAALQAESASPMETVYVAAARAMLGGAAACEALHAQLVAFAGRGADGVELIYLKPALQQAIVTAFERGGAAAAPYLQAWQAEFQPLPGVARPVAVAAPPAPAPLLAAQAHREVPARFRVAFSFAGAERPFVTAAAQALERRLGRGSVFLDDWFQAWVAGQDADLLLQRIYGRQSDLVVMGVAAAYDDRPWTMVEHRVLRALAWGAKPGTREAMRVLPLRVGDGDVEGVPANAIVPDVRAMSADAVAELILARLRLVDG